MDLLFAFRDLHQRLLVQFSPAVARERACACILYLHSRIIHGTRAVCRGEIIVDCFHKVFLMNCVQVEGGVILVYRWFM